MENDVVLQVKNRLKTLLFDQAVLNYREHEFFHSSIGKRYGFLIWKLQPLNWEEFSEEVEELLLKKGYKAIPGACDVSTFEPEKKTGYKVMAFYKA